MNAVREWPKYLYRYRPDDRDYTTRELRALNNREIFLTPAAFLNDPFDCHPAVNVSRPKEISDAIRSVGVHNYARCRIERWERFGLSPDNATAKKHRQLSRDPVKSALLENRLLSRLPKIYRDEDLRISCFSEIPDSILMWSHYANSHKGFVVQYEVLTDLPDGPTVDFPLRVSYSRERPEISTARLFRYGLQELFSDDNFEDCLDIFALSKAEAWSYEREWRLVSWRREGEGFRIFDNLKPTKIIFGPLASDDFVKLTRRICPDIPVARANPSPSTYTLHINDDERALI